MTFYKIIMEYMKNEPPNNNSSNISSKTERNKKYLNEFKSSMQTLQISSELQEQLKVGNSGQYDFHNDIETKCIVALLSIQPNLYPESLTFKNYSSEEIRDNMKKFRKQAFSKMDTYFLKDLQEALITFIKKHTNDIKIQDKFISTIKETIMSDVYQKYNDIKLLIPNWDELENQISFKSLCMLDSDDKLVFMDFIKTAITSCITNAVEIANIMGNIRNEELIANAPKLEGHDNNIKLHELWPTQPIRLTSLNDIAFLEDKNNKEKVEEIIARYNQYYIDHTKEKGESAKRKVFKETKEYIEEELRKFLSPANAAQICEHIQYVNTISSPIMNYRSIWQDRTSEELLDEAVEKHLNPEQTITRTTMEGTCEQLGECFEEIQEDSKIPLPSFEELMEDFTRMGFFRMIPSR